MKKFPLIVLTIFSILSLSQYSCHSPTGPKQSNPPPDTTSSSFTWKEYTFGGNAGSSYFKDVAIVNDSDIWCVGAIYTAPDTIYNAAHWNGNVWTLLQIQFHTFCGQSHTSSYPISSVFEFSQNDVLFSDAGEIVHWNGKYYVNDCSVGSQINGSINKIWGISSEDYYIVGNAGTILHYTNGTWTKLESGTSLDIQDIWGVNNPSDGEVEILAVASDPGVSFDKAILSIQGNTVTKISDQPIAYTLQGVWFVPGKHYYVVGSGIYEKELLTDNEWADSVLEFTQYYTTCVRGNGENDVFVGGAFGELLHWNGATWKSYRETTSLANGSYGSIAVKGNIVVVVGESLEPGNLDTKAVLTMGNRH